MMLSGSTRSALPARGACNNVKETWQHAICDPRGRRLSVWRDPLPPYRRTDIAGGLSLHRLQAPIGIGVRNEPENAKGGCRANCRERRSNGPRALTTVTL